MSSTHLYDVTFIGSEFGPFTVLGPDLEQLRLLVLGELSADERMGQAYALDCLAMNISQVNQDADEGRIERPLTTEAYAEAIVKEYRANLAAVPPEFRQRLVASWANPAQNP